MATDDVQQRIAERRARRQQHLRSAELQAEWDKKLSSEGLHPEPLPKQLRGPRGTPERDRAVSREIPFAPPGRSQYDDSDSLDGKWARGTRIHDHPETEIQALMEAIPGHTPRPSTEGMSALRDALVDAIEAQPEPYRTAMLLYTGGSSLAEIGEELGTSKWTARSMIRQTKLDLVEQLKDHPEVVDYLEEE